MAARDLSFPRSRRLTRAAEFRQVRESGKKLGGDFVAISVLDTQTAAPFRSGIITSRKIGGAVVRNRTRRRLREVVRRNQRAIRPGIWIVTIARPRAATATYHELEQDWLRLAKRASILSV